MGVRFPLTAEALEEIRRYSLRAACPHCFHYVAAEDRCASEWPLGDQARWPLTGDEDPAEIELCKEFELA